MLDAVINNLNAFLYIYIVTSTFHKAVFGQFSFFLVVFGLISVLITWGTNETIQEYSQQNISQRSLVTQVLKIRFLIFLLCFFIVCSVGLVSKKNLLVIFGFEFIDWGWVMIVASIALILEPIRTLAYSQGDSKHVVICRLVTFIFTLPAKIYIFLYSDLSTINQVAIIFFVDTVLYYSLCSTYWVKIPKVSPIINSIRTNKIFRDSTPFLLAGFISMLYMKVDQLSISFYMDYTQLGDYSVAVSFSQFWLILPSVLISSQFSTIRKVYFSEKSIKYIYAKVYVLMFFLCLVFLALSTIAIKLFFPAYVTSLPILWILSWSGFFVAVRILSGKIYLIDSLGKLTFYRSIIGLLTNATLNMITIPFIGLYGAALSTLFSLFMVSFVFDLFSKTTVIYFKDKLSGFRLIRTILGVK